MTIADNLGAAHRLAAEKGGECMATENFTIHDSVEWKCAEGHMWAAAFYSVRRGRWCRQCDNAKKHEAMVHDNLTQARRLAARRGGECLAAENFAQSEIVRWRCSEGHEWSARYSNVKFRGSWCPSCLYKTEAFCRLVLETLFRGKPFEKTRGLPWLRLGAKGSPLELDAYNEELKLALEFNGYQHEEPVDRFGGPDALKGIQARDANKAEACDANGVCLIVVTETAVRKPGSDLVSDVKVVNAIWSAVADMRYPTGVHLGSVEELLAALNL